MVMKKTLVALAVVSAVSLTAPAASASPHHDDGSYQFGPQALRAATLKSFMEMDKNDDGEVTRYEAEQAYNARYRVMSTIDGKPGMTLDEFLEGPNVMRDERMGRYMDEQIAALKRRFDVLDRSGDGRVSPYEFETAPVPASARRELGDAAVHELAEDREDAFARIDHDDDGYLDRDEYAHLHDHGPDGEQLGGSMSPALKARLDKYRTTQFDDADTNGDGNLSRVEYQKDEWKRFDRLDRNNDDVISFEEIKRTLTGSNT